MPRETRLSTQTTFTGIIVILLALAPAHAAAVQPAPGITSTTGQHSLAPDPGAASGWEETRPNQRDTPTPTGTATNTTQNSTGGGFLSGLGKFLDNQPKVSINLAQGFQAGILGLVTSGGATLKNQLYTALVCVGLTTPNYADTQPFTSELPSNPYCSTLVNFGGVDLGAHQLFIILGLSLVSIYSMFEITRLWIRGAASELPLVAIKTGLAMIFVKNPDITWDLAVGLVSSLVGAFLPSTGSQVNQLGSVIGVSSLNPLINAAFLPIFILKSVLLILLFFAFLANVIRFVGMIFLYYLWPLLIVKWIAPGNIPVVDSFLSGTERLVPFLYYPLFPALAVGFTISLQVSVGGGVFNTGVIKPALADIVGTIALCAGTYAGLKASMAGKIVLKGMKAAGTVALTAGAGFALGGAGGAVRGLSMGSRYGSTAGVLAGADEGRRQREGLAGALFEDDEGVFQEDDNEPETANDMAGLLTDEDEGLPGDEDPTDEAADRDDDLTGDFNDLNGLTSDFEEDTPEDQIDPRTTDTDRSPGRPEDDSRSIVDSIRDTLSDITGGSGVEIDPEEPISAAGLDDDELRKKMQKHPAYPDPPEDEDPHELLNDPDYKDGIDKGMIGWGLGGREHTPEDPPQGEQPQDDSLQREPRQKKTGAREPEQEEEPPVGDEKGTGQDRTRPDQHTTSVGDRPTPTAVDDNIGDGKDTTQGGYTTMADKPDPEATFGHMEQNLPLDQVETDADKEMAQHFASQGHDGRGTIETTTDDGTEVILGQNGVILAADDASTWSQGKLRVNKDGERVHADPKDYERISMNYAGNTEANTGELRQQYKDHIEAIGGNPDEVVFRDTDIGVHDVTNDRWVRVSQNTYPSAYGEVEGSGGGKKWTIDPDKHTLPYEAVAEFQSDIAGGQISSWKDLRKASDNGQVEMDVPSGVSGFVSITGTDGEEVVNERTYVSNDAVGMALDVSGNRLTNPTDYTSDTTTHPSKTNTVHTMPNSEEGTVQITPQSKQAVSVYGEILNKTNISGLSRAHTDTDKISYNVNLEQLPDDVDPTLLAAHPGEAAKQYTDNDTDLDIDTDTEFVSDLVIDDIALERLNDHSDIVDDIKLADEV
ncbi:hypothetical protein RYH80_18720 [Halobaculum sp. MBLA0147]|uniref:hypothetical protein n=1 Tax=Halobaculum sp. MBLA0147 TaxID=3079934 RepID=UPI0035265A5F